MDLEITQISAKLLLNLVKGSLMGGLLKRVNMRTIKSIEKKSKCYGTQDCISNTAGNNRQNIDW